MSNFYSKYFILDVINHQHSHPKSNLNKWNMSQRNGVVIGTHITIYQIQNVIWFISVWMRTMACGIEFDYNKLVCGIVAAVADIDMGRVKRWEVWILYYRNTYIWLVVVYLFFRFFVVDNFRYDMRVTNANESYCITDILYV